MVQDLTWGLGAPGSCVQCKPNRYVLLPKKPSPVFSKHYSHTSQTILLPCTDDQSQQQSNIILPSNGLFGPLHKAGFAFRNTTQKVNIVAAEIATFVVVFFPF